MFQFQTGAIKRDNFQHDPAINLQRFQFQTGAIKRLTDSSIKSIASLFQFQTGAIKSDERFSGGAVRHSRFNSKLVRLKV